MPDAKDLAYKDYLAGMKYKDIAEKYGVSLSAVKSWASREWKKVAEGKSQPKNKKVATKSKKGCNQNEKISSLKTTKKKSDKSSSGKKPDKSKEKTNSNTPSPFARMGNKNAEGNAGGTGAPLRNQNARGNRGGPGGPIRNKKALTTGEFETIFFTPEIIDEQERALLDADYDKYIMQYLLIDTLTIREKRILKRIKEIENTPGGMIFESITKNKGTQTTAFTNHNKGGESWEGNEMTATQGNSSHVAKPVIKRVMELEDALTRVQGRKQSAIAQLHRMEMDDERLIIDSTKLDIYRQRISGKVDLDALMDDDIEFELELD